MARCKELVEVKNGEAPQKWDSFAQHMLKIAVDGFKLNQFEKAEIHKFMLRIIKYRNRLVNVGYTGAITCKGLERLYNIDMSKYIDNDFNFKYKTKDAESFDKSLNDYIYKSLLNLNLSDECLIKHKLMWLKEIFDLNKLETDYLAGVYCYDNSFFMNVIKDCSYNFYDAFMESYSFDNSALKTPTASQCDDMLRKLRDSGILTLDYHTSTFTTLYYDLFRDESLTTKSLLYHRIMGDPLKADLKLSEFEHVKNKDLVVSVLKNAVKQRKKGINILLHGAVGTGKSEIAKSLAAKAGLKLYSVKTSKNQKELKREDRLLDLFSKQAILAKAEKACILFDEAEDVLNRGFSEDGVASKGYLNHMLETMGVPCIWTSNNTYGVDPAFLRRMHYSMEFGSLTEEQRFKLWNRIIKKSGLKVSKSKLQELSKIYDIPASIITNAVEATKLINGDENDFEKFIEPIAELVAKKNDVKKSDVVEKSRYSLDLVNAELDIPLLIKRVKETGKFNFSMCFYGCPGSSKSLTARYIAKELGLDVVQKRASDILSKWVGEDEQNIRDAFAEAKQKKAMLIIDEGDSFLQSREKSNAFWETSLVGEMLSQMENIEYPFVITSNLMDNLDEAALRRFVFKCKFNYLDKSRVKKCFKHFFNVETDWFINGLAIGDFSTVKKKTDYLGIPSTEELCKLLEEEVKLKHDKDLKNSIGF